MCITGSGQKSGPKSQREYECLRQSQHRHSTLNVASAPAQSNNCATNARAPAARVWVVSNVRAGWPAQTQIPPATIDAHEHNFECMDICKHACLLTIHRRSARRPFHKTISNRAVAIKLELRDAQGLRGLTQRGGNAPERSLRLNDFSRRCVVPHPRHGRGVVIAAARCSEHFHLNYASSALHR